MTTSSIDVKTDLVVKINLTIKQTSIRKNMKWQRKFISQGSPFRRLKHEKECKENLNYKSLSFGITLVH